MYNNFVVSDNLLGNTTLHNRSEGVTNRRSDQQYDDTSSGSYSEMCYDVFIFLPENDWNVKKVRSSSYPCYERTYKERG